jgi:hypothetical protein
MPRRFRRMLSGLTVASILFSPLSLWALWKPVRALKPEWAGVQCFEGNVCIDDATKLPQALALRAEAVSFVAGWAGSFDAAPRAIFCTTSVCDRSFGFKGNAAYNLGARALVVASRGWKPHYVRHELIHCVQVERIGGLRMLLHTPTWLIEGMAYSASQDPRRPLTEPWETYRKSFEDWASQVPPRELWSQAAGL